jgi:hypothetical protein
MKRIALLLAVLAAAKIGTVEHLHRSATRDALVTAYGKDAVAACQKAMPNGTQTGALRPGPMWGATNFVRVEVGNRQTEVALWQVDHQDWQARFRRTYLVLDAAVARCHFDVVTGTASVVEL